MIVLIADSDPRKDVVGGIGVYAASLAAHLHDEVIFLGKAQASEVKKKVPFSVSLVTKKPGQNNLLFMKGLFSVSEKIKLPADAVVHAQRPDWIIPFRHHPGLKVVTLHGSHYANVRMKKGFLVAFFYGLLEKWAFKIADKVVAVDKENFALYKTRYPFAAEKMVLVPVAVDTNKFTLLPKSKVMRELGVASKNKIFLFVGRLSKEKRVDEMIKALREETLLIAGVGEEEEYLRSLARGKDVRFLGALPQESLVKWYNAADALLLFSTHEGLPTVVLEAFACGLPVICTPVGEVPFLVREGENGFLVRGKAFRPAMERFLSCRDDLSKECRRTALAFDWSKVVLKLEEEVYYS